MEMTYSIPASHTHIHTMTSSEDSSQVELNGIFFNGSLYLVDPLKKLVYSSELQDDNGAHVLVGRCGEDGEPGESNDLTWFSLTSVVEVVLFHQAPPPLPFEADPADHCETPDLAYVDIAPALEALAKYVHVCVCDLRLFKRRLCSSNYVT